MDIGLNIDKSPIPLIWIDTSIVIKMAKLKVEEKIDKLEKERAQYLYDAIKRKTNNKQLLCPEADQKEEYDVGERLEEECRRIQTELSLGILMKHRQSIEDLFIDKFMRAYINKEMEINISYKDLFYRDPLEELEEKISKKFVISVDMFPPKALITRRKKTKKSLQRNLEALRKRNITTGITFEQQLETEFRGTLDGYLLLLEKFLSRLEKGQVLFWDFLGTTNILLYEKLWNNYGGQPPGLKGVSQFFLSDYFKQIPKIEIVCHLYAKILTGAVPIKSGDAMDIKQISTILPFFNFIITDKYMKHVIETLGYHKKYSTDILALKNFNEIKLFFEKL